MGKASDRRAVQRLWQARDQATDRLIKAARRELGEHAFQDALGEFASAVGMVDDDDEVQAPDDDPRLAVFVPWFLYHWLPGEAALDDWPSEDTIVARYLRSRRGSSAFVDRYMEAVRCEPFTFWEVVEAEPGAAMRLKDLVLDRETWVSESSASSGIPPWTILFGQVVEFGGASVLHASIPIAFPPDVRELVEEGTARFRGRQVHDRTDLLGYDIDMLMIAGHALDGLFQAAQRTPVLTNTDGQALVWTTTRYTFDPGDRDEVIGCVAAIEDMHDDGETEDGEAEFVRVIDQPGNHTMPNVTKGRVLVGDGVLTSECNSVERDEAMRQLLETACGTYVAYEATETQELDLEEIRRNAEALPSGDRSGIDPDLEAKLSPEERAEIIGFMRDRFLAWADDPVPALDGVTPREAVKTPEGRKKVIELIKGWEHMSGRGGEIMEGQDFEALRETLGLTADE